MVISTHLPPPVMIDSTADRAAVTHILCWSCAMCFSAAASSEKFHGSGFEHVAVRLDPAIEGSRHPAVHGMKDLALNVRHDLAGVFLVPVPVQPLGHGAELDQKVA